MSWDSFKGRLRQWPKLSMFHLMWATVGISCEAATRVRIALARCVEEDTRHSAAPRTLLVSLDESSIWDATVRHIVRCASSVYACAVRALASTARSGSAARPRRPP